MHSVNIHKVISRLISVLYRIGFWHHGDKITRTKLGMQTFYSVYYSFFTYTLALGAFKSENVSESIFAAEVSIAVGVLVVKLWVLMRNQKQILNLLDRICVFSIQYGDDFRFFNQKLGKFMTFATAFLCASTMACVIEVIVFPIIYRNERTLIYDIEFPLFDWRKNKIVYWIAYIFLGTELFITLIVLVFSVMVWYIILVCSLRYQVLAREIRKMGSTMEENGSLKFSKMEKCDHFVLELEKSIHDHINLRRLIEKLASLTSNLFLIQFATSGLCICGSIYGLAFDTTNNFAKTMVHVYTMFYHISELFMITYLGNEILVSSDRLTYSLFESNWVEQPQSTKTCMLIFAEYSKEPHQLLVAKLYPLTLETFRRILKSAYSLFNILKSTNN
ncbi:odorant receptor 33b-like isoform X2 [Bradysia coprophila]|uniref:odorant receptor 33b-like isoform X2 n=1 Tax=Bradysia coprophila TaxID=38358 RepID=UPI00187D6F0A|nr:odorant receptor 33b-like isoform X2 [Bradysia coprophila]